MKTSKLINSINRFYKKAFHLLFSFGRDFSDPQENNDFLEQAEEFDIKDEDLYNLFSKFTEVYKEFLEEIEFDISDLESDSFGEAAELAGKLQKLYKQIQELPYLNMSEEEGYEEEFEPDDLIELLNRAMDNASAAIRNASGMEISDAAAAQIANQFNNHQVDKSSFSNSGLRMTGPIVQQKLAAFRRWYQNLKFNYESAQSYKSKRKERAEKFKRENPEIYQAIVKRKVKQKKDRNEKRKRILKLLETTTDTKIKAELEKELIKLELDAKKHLTRKDDDGKEIPIEITLEQAKNQADVLGKQRKRNQISNVNKTQRLKGGGIVAAIESLGIKISSLKQYAKRQSTSKIIENPELISLKEELNNLGAKIKISPSIDLLKQQELLEKKLTQLTLDLINQNEKFVEINKDLKIILDYRDKVSEAFKAGWISKEALPEQKDFCFTLIADGKNLLNIYSKKYDAIGKNLELLINEINLLIS